MPLTTSLDDTPQATLEVHPDQLDLFGKLVVGHEVVAAPLEELGSRQMPRTLRKANAAVHVYPVAGTYSLPMRRLFNATVALGHAKLRRMPEGTFDMLVTESKVLRFEASATDLKRLIGWANSGDNQSLYEMLDGLQTLKVVWDVMDGNGEKWETHGTLLGEWARTSEGKVAWLWTPGVFSLLFDPTNPFTPLDLELTRSFNSRYTLALYENTFRYRNIRHTPWRAPNDWKLLIAGHDLYPDFREFKRSVIKVALSEIEKTPTCPVTLELEEKRGMFNRVESMRFLVKPKLQEALGVSLPADINPALGQRLHNFGVADDKVRQLLRDYDEAYLLSQLGLLERELSKKQLTNPAGFLVRAIEERYKDEVSKHEATVAARLTETKKLAQRSDIEARWRMFRRDEAQRWWDGQPEEARAPLKKKFFAAATPTVKRMYGRGGFSNKGFLVLFLEWLCEVDGVLVSVEAKDLVSYVTFSGV